MTHGYSAAEFGGIKGFSPDHLTVPDTAMFRLDRATQLLTATSRDPMRRTMNKLAWTLTRGSMGVSAGFQEILAAENEAAKQLLWENTYLQPKKIAVISSPGGSAKTSTAFICAHISQMWLGDTVALDANPDNGVLITCARRRTSEMSLPDLLNDIEQAGNIRVDTKMHLDRYLTKIYPYGLSVLASDRAERTLAAENLSADQIWTVVARIANFYKRIWIDCGTGPNHPTTSVPIRESDAVIMSTRADTRSLQATRDYVYLLLTRGYEDAMRTATFVVSGINFTQFGGVVTNWEREMREEFKEVLGHARFHGIPHSRLLAPRQDPGAISMNERPPTIDIDEIAQEEPQVMSAYRRLVFDVLDGLATDAPDDHERFHPLEMDINRRVPRRLTEPSFLPE